MTDLALSLALLGVVVFLMWKASQSGSAQERAKQAEKAVDDAYKAALARASADAGNGVPVERDRFNRDNLHRD